LERLLQLRRHPYGKLGTAAPAVGGILREPGFLPRANNPLGGAKAPHMTTGTHADGWHDSTAAHQAPNRLGGYAKHRGKLSSVYMLDQIKHRKILVVKNLLYHVLTASQQ